MTIKNKYCNTITQTEGGHYRIFNHTSNIKNKEDTYAETNTILGKSQNLNRPSTLTLTNFKTELPTGAKVTKIKVYYKQRKTGGCNIGAPTITLMADGKPLKYSGSQKNCTKKGQAPTHEDITETVTFKSAWQWRTINGGNFGVKIDYPTNSNEKEGTIRLYYVRLEVTYVTANYGIKIKKISGGYNHEDYTISVTLTNTNKVYYNPSCVITAPAGFTFKSVRGDGNFQTGTQQRTWLWAPSIIGKASNRITLVFTPSVTYAEGQSSYSGTFDASYTVDTGNTGYTTHTATITERPETSDDTSTEDIDTIDGETEQLTIPSVVIQKGKTNLLTITYDLDNHPEFPTSQAITLSNGGSIQFRSGSSYVDTYNLVYSDLVAGDGELTVEIKGNSVGTGQLKLQTQTSEEEYYVFTNQKTEVYPDNLTVPNCTILELTEEEKNRLGHGIPYTMQGYMKLTSTESYIRNWGKNFKMGIFNNPISENITIIETVDPETGETTDEIIDSTDYNNLTPSTIFSKAEYWSNNLTTIGEFENIECDFVYNENYPFYIIVTGDYPQGNQSANTVKFAEPCIVEKQYYTGYEPNGLYPVGIDELCKVDSIAEVDIPSLETTAPVILYKLPLDDDYGTNTDIAVRGLEITGNIEKSDELVLYAKLIANNQESRERSIVLSDYDSNPDGSNDFSIGGVGDLWGFSTLDIVNLEDWELQITASNVLNNQTSTLNMGNIQLNIYIEEVESQNVKTYINNEDLSYYGVFLTDLKIPEGLETTTKYLNNDGTDLNKAYRQNIKEKEITVEFTIDGCTLNDSTTSLQELTRLLVNKRDKYNRPIPNRIEFSHYPNLYWEYILEKSLDTDVEVSSYKVKAKLTIPSGTAYNKNPTTTNSSGYVSGLAHVNPIVTIQPYDDTIEIREETSGQTFHMGYSGTWNDGIVEIDCENRKVTYKTNEDDDDGVDLTRYVDFNTDWFTLYENYNFETVNCIIRTITYTERW